MTNTDPVPSSSMRYSNTSQVHDDRDINRIVRNLLEHRRGHISTVPGRSQYSINGKGTSACGLAALNCARLILTKEKDGIKGVELLRLMMRKDTLEVSAEFIDQSC